MYNFAYNVTVIGDGEGFCYNTINLNYIGGYSYIGLRILANNGWNNENLYIGGRFIVFSSCRVKSICRGVVFDGNGNSIDNNVFIKPCVEGSYIGFEFIRGTTNTIFAPRVENCTYSVDFGATQSNIVLPGYNRDNNLKVSPNNGNESVYIKDAISLAIREKVIDTQIMKYSGAADLNSNLIQLLNNTTISGNSARGISSFGFIIDASYFKRWFISQDVDKRFYVVPLDDSFNPISVSDIKDYMVSGGWQINSKGVIYTTSDMFSNWLIFTNVVKYVFVGVDVTAKNVTLCVLVQSIGRTVNFTPQKYIVWPYDVKNINVIPTTTENVPFGYRVYCVEANSYITWNGSVWLTDKGFTAAPTKGTTRPTGTGGGGVLDATRDIGFEFFDTNPNVMKPIYASAIANDGTVTWVDATGATV